jgi:diguanylate cyclase (GGDEF)-like protein/PAS domain S-box-containing protein
MRRLLRTSIAARSSAMIIAIVAAIGLGLLSISMSLIWREEGVRQKAQVEENFAIVESTLSLACFLSDRNLAQEIAQGLVRDRSIARVVVKAGGKVLADVVDPNGAQPFEIEALPDDTTVHRVASPFNPGEIVGEVTIVTDPVEIRSHVAHAAWMAGIPVALQVLFTGLAAVLVVVHLITRPISRISEKLHDLHAETGQKLVVPAGNEMDEVGRLVTDVNSMADNLVQFLDKAREDEESLREMYRSLEAMGEANAIAAAVISNSSEAVMVMDAALRIESVNPAFEAITGYPAVEAIGHSPKILFSGRHDDEFFRRLHERVDADGHWSGEIWNKRRGGEIYPQQSSINLLRDANGRITHYATVFSDNTERNRLEARLRELSTTDGLTGIANRRAFDAAVGQEWSRAARGSRPLSLAMIDIDHFKAYNDLHGHPGGDECLRQVARAIAATSRRASDFTARYGGEEFAVILPELGPQAAAALAERIRAAVESLALPHGASQTAGVVTISIGVATLEPGANEGEVFAAQKLIDQADRALYAAKSAGRNRVGQAPAAGRSTPSARAAAHDPSIPTLAKAADAR